MIAALALPAFSRLRQKDVSGQAQWGSDDGDPARRGQ